MDYFGWKFNQQNNSAVCFSSLQLIFLLLSSFPCLSAALRRWPSLCQHKADSNGKHHLLSQLNLLLQHINLDRSEKERFIRVPRLLIKCDLLSYPDIFGFHLLLSRQSAWNEVKHPHECSRYQQCLRRGAEGDRLTGLMSHCGPIGHKDGSEREMGRDMQMITTACRAVF